MQSLRSTDEFVLNSASDNQPTKTDLRSSA